MPNWSRVAVKIEDVRAHSSYIDEQCSDCQKSVTVGIKTNTDGLARKDLAVLKDILTECVDSIDVAMAALDE